VAQPMLLLDYGNALSSAIGGTHGLSPQELERGEKELTAAVERIEQQRRRGEHRYRELPSDRTMLAQVRAALRRYRGRFENLVVLGIGGSALGNIALQTALNPPLYNLLPARRRSGPRLFVMDNVDPVHFATLLELLGSGQRRTLFNVISKSGETAETAAQFLIVRDLIARRLGGKAVTRQILLTTDPAAGTLRELADRDGYDTLPVPPGVGGRWSVLSAVGLFSAGMCGIDIGRLLGGAAQMNERVARPSPRENPAARLAQLLHAFYVRGKRLHVLFAYSDQLKDMADWFRQLWAESLGKSQDLEGRPAVIGPTPIRAVGATDQHSQVQLFREGPNDKVFIFLEVERFARDVRIPRGRGLPEALAYLGGATLGRLLNAEKRATEYALVASQRPCLTIRFPQINETTVGQFVLLWEATTTIMAALLGVNAYDQPAVQLGKEYTFALMGRGGYEQQAEQWRRFADGSGRYVV
jgi:glucose-6-phosphate isomerase